MTRKRHHIAHLLSYLGEINILSYPYASEATRRTYSEKPASRGKKQASTHAPS